MKMFAPALAAAAVLAAPLNLAPLHAAPRDKGETEFQKLIAGRVPGKPVRCLSQTSITSSYIIPGKAIVYRVGSRTYVNQPRSGADTLRRHDVLLTRNIGTNLCRTDSVRLIDRNSRFVRGFVVLGDFVPYTKAKD
ncbi:hypothetical protein [Sphingomonas jeddahensis]|uniref:Uncharacterized protein n=1 Tax=Sphingomonas jeddahensis TaxID=1915074 RepID=A0A1V2ES88_9SPHN|nr:hypothetical protein [Sphingomonas jeddahensis]ONF95532.1 hypothetical protein SPHI_21990 [Sphingomonas jeddahensis]